MSFPHSPFLLSVGLASLVSFLVGRPGRAVLLSPQGGFNLVADVCACAWANRGVAVGSSIGHAIGGFFGGGSAAAPAEAQQQQADTATNAYGDAAQTAGGNEWGVRNCEVDARQFTKCLDENAGNMQICGWYLDQLVSVY